MVGFNRRFAPLIIELQQQLRRLSGPKGFRVHLQRGVHSPRPLDSTP